MSDNPHDKM